MTRLAVLSILTSFLRVMKRTVKECTCKLMATTNNQTGITSHDLIHDVKMFRNQFINILLILYPAVALIQVFSNQSSRGFLEKKQKITVSIH